MNSKPVVRSRAHRSAHRLAVEAVSWMTPVKRGGSPISLPSQTMTTCSSSVAAGQDCQTMPLTPRAAESSSARMEGPEWLAGK